MSRPQNRKEHMTERTAALSDQELAANQRTAAFSDQELAANQQELYCYNPWSEETNRHSICSLSHSDDKINGGMQIR